MWYLRLNPLAFTLTPLFVNIRIFPSDPDVDELPLKLKVPGAHGGGGGVMLRVDVGSMALLAIGIAAANLCAAKTGVMALAKNIANNVIRANIFLIFLLLFLSSSWFNPSIRLSVTIRKLRAHLSRSLT